MRCLTQVAVQVPETPGFLTREQGSCPSPLHQGRRKRMADMPPPLVRAQRRPTWAAWTCLPTGLVQAAPELRANPWGSQLSPRAPEFRTARASGDRAPSIELDRPRPLRHSRPTHSRSHCTPARHQSPPATIPDTIPQTQPKMCTHGSPRGHTISGTHQGPVTHNSTTQRNTGTPPNTHTQTCARTRTRTRTHTHTRRKPGHSGRQGTRPQSRSPPLPYLLQSRTQSAGFPISSSAPRWGRRWPLPGMSAPRSGRVARSSGLLAPAAAAPALRSSPSRKTKGSRQQGREPAGPPVRRLQTQRPACQPREGRDAKAGPGGGRGAGHAAQGGRSSFLRTCPPQPRLHISPARALALATPQLVPWRRTPAPFHTNPSSFRRILGGAAPQPSSRPAQISDGGILLPPPKPLASGPRVGERPGGGAQEEPALRQIPRLPRSLQEVQLWVAQKGKRPSRPRPPARPLWPPHTPIPRCASVSRYYQPSCASCMAGSQGPEQGDRPARALVDCATSRLLGQATRGAPASTPLR